MIELVPRNEWEGRLIHGQGPPPPPHALTLIPPFSNDVKHVSVHAGHRFLIFDILAICVPTFVALR